MAEVGAVPDHLQGALQAGLTISQGEIGCTGQDSWAHKLDEGPGVCQRHLTQPACSTGGQMWKQLQGDQSMQQAMRAPAVAAPQAAEINGAGCMTEGVRPLTACSCSGFGPCSPQINNRKLLRAAQCWILNSLWPLLAWACFDFRSTGFNTEEASATIMCQSAHWGS